VALKPTTTTVPIVYALDLIELIGDDLRGEPLEVREASPVSVLAKAALKRDVEEDGAKSDG
jgi:hypothetical protein